MITVRSGYSAAPASAKPTAERGPTITRLIQPTSTRSPGPQARAGVIGAQPLRVLLVEDDTADAFLVGELLSEAEAPVDLMVASSLAEAVGLLAGIDCVVLDLGLPDAQGLEGLRKLLDLAGPAAVCVLTGLADEHLGLAAVAEGAQDYLIKGRVDGILLTRALRYAVERKRADENARRLREAELRQEESARLERGLLPHPQVRSDALRVYPFYRPGRHSGLLGGDFYDMVQTGPDTFEFMIGDVCGHSVEEAALGAELRVAWRTLVLAGVDEVERLPALERVLISERHLDHVFATIATISMDLGRGRAGIRLAGHPPPIYLADGRVRPMPARFGPVLGVFEDVSWHRTEWTLDAADWKLLLYTDGLIEGRVGGGDDRLAIEGLCDLLDEPDARALPPESLSEWLFARAEVANKGPLADDVAIILIVHNGETTVHKGRNG